MIYHLTLCVSSCFTKPTHLFLLRGVMKHYLYYLLTQTHLLYTGCLPGLAAIYSLSGPSGPLKLLLYPCSSDIYPYFESNKQLTTAFCLVWFNNSSQAYSYKVKGIHLPLSELTVYIRAEILTNEVRAHTVLAEVNTLNLRVNAFQM